jgi:hypothetical protein
MLLLAQAAMLLSFDVVPEAVPEHDDWHTHEHLPERLAIPGFLRGMRWVALRGRPRYMVVYEVSQLDVLTSDAYLRRLNNPTPWTTKMMASYRGMNRGLCSVTGSFGLGIGHVGLLVRFKPEPGAAAPMRKWLLQDVLPPLSSQPGIGSVHLLEGALTAPMTNEQRIRGADSGVDWAVLATGYRQEALSKLAQAELGGARLEQQGATSVLDATYRVDYALYHDEIRA